MVIKASCPDRHKMALDTFYLSLVCIPSKIHHVVLTRVGLLLYIVHLTPFSASSKRAASATSKVFIVLRHRCFICSRGGRTRRHNRQLLSILREHIHTRFPLNWEWILRERMDLHPTPMSMVKGMIVAPYYVDLCTEWVWHPFKKVQR